MCLGYSSPPPPQPAPIPVFFNRIQEPRVQLNEQATGRDKEEQAASQRGKRRLQIPLTTTSVSSGLGIPPSGRR